MRGRSVRAWTYRVSAEDGLWDWTDTGDTSGSYTEAVGAGNKFFRVR